MAGGAALSEVEGRGADGEDQGALCAGGDLRGGGAGEEHHDAATGGEGFQGTAGLVGAVKCVEWGAEWGGDACDEGAPPEGTEVGGGARGGEQQDGAARREGVAGVGGTVDDDRWGEDHA